MTDQDIIRTLTSRYETATPAQVRQGREWYPRYLAEARRVARKTGTTVHRAAAVGAITSPNAQLVQNLNWMRDVCAGHREHGQYYGSQAWKTRAALNRANPRPSEFVLGPKVSVFYRAVLGDTDAITIDRWAAHAAGMERMRAPSKAEHAQLDRCYRRAAELCGETPRDFQAIVWTQARETDSGKIYTDLHHMAA